VSALRLLALLLALGPAPALAQPRRAAVIILANRPATQALADDLTEVAMARVAQRRVEVVGTREFRGRLGMLRDPRACLADASCVARVAVELTVTRILVGSLAMEPNRYLFHLTLWDLPAGAPRNRVFRVVEGPLEDLVRIVQEATDAVLLPRLEPGRIQIDSEPRGARVFVDNVLLGVTPMLSPELPAGRHRLAVDRERRFPWASTVEVPPGQRLEIRLSPQHLPLRRRWPGYVAWSTGGGALLAGAGGVLLAAQSQGARADATRQEAMLDFQRRQRLGSVSTAVLLSSALLAGISAYHFLRYHRDIFGRADPLP
jgi:hypothetical protein